MSLSLCGAAGGDQLIEITASVDKQTAYIGDIIDYAITITYDSTLRLTPPAVGANLGGFDVKDYDVGDEKILDDGRRQQVIRFNIRTFTTGEYVIPPLPIEYTFPDSTKKYITADPIKIEIKSLLGEGAAADTLQLRPLKKQVSLAGDRTKLILSIVAAALVIIAVIVYVILRRRRTKPGEEYVDPRPAWEIAFADLAMLKERGLPAKGEIKLFYIELSDIFRRYLDRKFDFAAIDMTTEEINDTLTFLTMNDNIRNEVISFLEHADLVKFAKYIPPVERPGQDWETAYGLVEKTRDIILTPIIKPEVEPVVSIKDESDTSEDPELKYIPPELRDRFAPQKKEDTL
jgi:hypothetical protein